MDEFYFGNMSQTTKEFESVLSEAIKAHKPGNYLIHEAYEIINEQVAHGIPWNKCQNCGSPYRLDSDGATGTHCSQNCESEAIADLNSSLDYRHFDLYE